MKVLHVIPSVGPARGGPSEAVLAMVRALKQEGVQADITTTNDNGLGVLAVSTGRWSDHEGANVFFHERWSPRFAALREFQFAPHFDEWLRQQLPNYDGIHIHAVFSYLSTAAMHRCRKAGKPFIVRPLGQLDPWSLRQRATKKRLYFNWIEKKHLLTAKAIHCTSASEADSVKALLPNARTEIIPHGIETFDTAPGAADALRREWGIHAESKVLLFLSRWHPKKNILLLLQALSEMRKEPWHLILAGTASDGYERQVQQSIQAHGLGAHVTCPGHVQGAEKQLLLNGSDAFVLPSASENFGIALAEALCAGLPCVTTHGVALADTVNESKAGVCCAPEVEALRSALHQVLATSYDRARIRAAACERFSWATAAARLHELYAESFKANTTEHA